MILEHVSCLNVAHSVILKVAAWNVMSVWSGILTSSLLDFQLTACWSIYCN